MVREVHGVVIEVVVLAKVNPVIRPTVQQPGQGIS